MGSGRRSWAVSVQLAGLAFLALTLAFGVIPSEFIGWFNKKYNDPNLQRFIRDPIVVLWHLVAIAGFVAYAVKYQVMQEKKAKEVESQPQPAESAYGRPIRKEGG